MRGMNTIEEFYSESKKYVDLFNTFAEKHTLPGWNMTYLAERSVALSSSSRIMRAEFARVTGLPLAKFK